MLVPGSVVGADFVRLTCGRRNEMGRLDVNWMWQKGRVQVRRPSEAAS